MQKSITLKGKEFPYTLRLNKRSRSIRFSIYRGGKFIVTAPQHISLRRIEKSIVEKSEWILEKISVLSKLKPLGKKYTKVDFKKYKESARVFVLEKLAHYNRFYNFSWKNVTIRNQKSRWGSCSSKGNLNFNYKIALLPPHLAEYIVVHELCHLGELNHSQAFWDLVQKSIPEYKKIRSELKKMSLRYY